MKRKVLIGALLWLILITLLHVHLNVGWGRLVGMWHGERDLQVGYLPVT